MARAPIQDVTADRDSVGYALLVGDPDNVLSKALGQVIGVVHCPAAPSMKCPAMGSQRCSVRDNARVTVVFVPTGTDLRRRITCVAASDAPVVAVIEDSSIGPMITGRFGVVGADAGPLGILGALSGVIDSTDGRRSSGGADDGTP